MTTIERPGAATPMPATKQPPADGNIHGALADLGHAINDLTDSIIDITPDGETLHAASLYDQLRVAVGGTQSQTGTGGGGKSRPPMWTDAFDLLNQIDTAVGAWNPGHCCQPATRCRLRCITTRRWRPQDTHRVRKITGIIRAWIEQITRLFGPQHIKYVQAACPACGETTTLRRDSAGELVREAALQIITEVGCSCVVCGASWGPERYLFLGEVLGFKRPEGVLE